MKRGLPLALLLTTLALAQVNGIVTHGSRAAPRIALTFDSDMTPGMKANLLSGRVASYNNTRIYEILQRYGVTATFFMTGMWMELYPAQVQEFLKRGYELENHSYSHPGFLWPCYGLPGVAQNLKLEQVARTKRMLEALGVKNKYFRFPGGCASTSDVKLVESLELRVVHWDVIGLDGGAQNAQVIISNVLNGVKNGSIIVLHNHGGPKVLYTAPALNVIVPSLLKRGFKFVTVAQLLEGQP